MSRDTRSGGGEVQGDVVTARAGPVLTVRLSAPERLNAVSAPMLDRVRAVLEDADADTSVRAVVLTGAGRAFCSGAHLALEAEPKDQEPDTSTLRSANRLVATLTGLGTVVVCGLNGAAAGVGASIALACDVIVAHEDAYFLLAFAKIGLMPDGGATALVAASLGRSRALQLALLADRLSAREAHAAGLVWSLHGADTFDTEVKAVAARLAAGPTRALGRTKRAINAAAIAGLDDAIGREWDGQLALLSGPEFAEGVDAFLSRRPARFDR
ncbi:enoyl-CoA hydratase-related protein [Streptomyces antimycoticus]|uniref:enoyl-CoA hydratase-related protein n=1 Tax=Streptomyces antimycoticus TaxID=68175 RepID=UPI000A3724AF|nr:enoyl-CoA hydratase-related protein [Streptomyces antimycoticus]